MLSFVISILAGNPTWITVKEEVSVPLTLAPAVLPLSSLTNENIVQVKNTFLPLSALLSLSRFSTVVSCVLALSCSGESAGGDAL